VGPFDDVIRPFTVNGSNTLAFVNINKLLGFEIGDIRTGKKLYRVEVEGYKQGPVKRHGCPAHGIALTPDEKELWLADCANEAIHVFDATVMPPKQKTTIKARDCVGWVSFSLDGRTAYSSTGEMIDAESKKIVAALTDETGRQVQSEKQLELTIANGKVVRAGNQFGVGAVRK
jgi:DNA-binding beta-propeller fold protein YncE